MLTLNGPGLLLQAPENSTLSSSNLPPSNIAPPELIGKAEVGTTVSARPGVWAGLPIPQVQTTLLVNGAARRSPCLLDPEDDGKEIVVIDVASNGAGEAMVSSSRVFVRHPVPHALGIPESISIGTNGEAVVVDARAFFVGTSGGQWSAACVAGVDALLLDIDQTGRVTLGSGTLIGSCVISVSYANSGGSISVMFPVFSNDAAPAEDPQYDGSLSDLSIAIGEPIAIEAGLAFTGIDLAFSTTGLPEGVTTDPETGRISGQASQVGSYGVTLIAANPTGSASATFRLEIVQKSLPLPDAPSYDGSLDAQQVNLGNAFELSAGYAFAGESLTFSATGLAQGLSIDAATGKISGTPSTSGEFAIVVTASNEGGRASGTFSLMVPEPSVAAPTYDGSLQSVEATIGVAFDLSAGNSFTGDDLTFSAKELPPGLAISAVTGQITGTPTTEGTFATTVAAKNPAGGTSGSFRIVVAESVPTEVPTLIGTLENRTYAVDSGARYYNISSVTTGTKPITFYMLPKVISVEIMDNGDGTYGRRALTAGYPNPTTTTEWLLDGSSIGRGETGDTIDADGLSGDLTVEVTATNTHGSHNLTSAGVALTAITNPVILGSSSTANGAGSSHNISTPAYSIGDLVLFNVGLDSGASVGGISTITPANGETVVTEQARFGDGGTGQTSNSLHWFIATSSETAGDNIAVTLSASDQLSSVAVVFDAGTFDATTPVADVTTATGNAASATSPATTATQAGGIAMAFIAADAQDITGTPAGWTKLDLADANASTSYTARKDGFTAASEAIAAATFTLEAAEDFAALTCVVKGA